MAKKQTSKKMVASSIIAMLICVAMLIGSTFAWFTDTKSAAVNQIQAGTLSVDLQNEAGTSIVGQTLNFVKAAGHESEPVLWEPGVTYNLDSFKVVNTGDVALKYQIKVTGVDGTAKLLEAISFTLNGQPIADAEVTVLPGQASDLQAIVGHMDEAAGNEYQGLTLDGVGITVVATQAAVEYDSVDNQYDASATYPVA